MKKLLALAVAAVATLGFSMSATPHSNQNSQDNTQKTEKKAPEKQKRDAKKQGRHDGKQHHKGIARDKKGFNPFEGLNLTEDQRTKIKAVFEEYRKAPRQANCCQVADAACCKGEGQKCCWEQTPEQAKQRVQEELGKIKEILTPDQYQKYLENAAMQQLMPKRRGFDKGIRHDKHGKQGKDSVKRASKGERADMKK